jgi:hypothetical protein
MVMSSSNPRRICQLSRSRRFGCREEREVAGQHRCRGPVGRRGSSRPGPPGRRLSGRYNPGLDRARWRVRETIVNPVTRRKRPPPDPSRHQLRLLVGGNLSWVSQPKLAFHEPNTSSLPPNESNSATHVGEPLTLERSVSCRHRRRPSPKSQSPTSNPPAPDWVHGLAKTLQPRSVTALGHHLHI